MSRCTANGELGAARGRSEHSWNFLSFTFQSMPAMFEFMPNHKAVLAGKKTLLEISAHWLTLVLSSSCLTYVASESMQDGRIPL